MTLEEIKRLIHAGDYDYSEKVRAFIEDGWFGEEDLEHCILSATEIFKTEKDELKVSIDGKKYVILGKDTFGYPFYTCGKIISGEGRRLYFFITAHEAD